MTIITLNFPNKINVSVQVGDIAYFCNTTSVGGFDTAFVPTSPNVTQPILQIGPITEVGDTYIKCELVSHAPSQGDFIMFSKDNKANMSSLLGYYGEFKFRNNSKTKAELFSVGSEVFESSK